MGFAGSKTTNAPVEFDSESDRGDAIKFADLVGVLLKDAKLGKPSASGQPLDVRKTVYGLAFLDQMVQAYCKDRPAEEKIATGAIEALEMLEALQTGLQHPIFDFITGIRAKARLNRPPATSRTLVVRDAAVGMVIAYQKLAHCSERAACRVVAECLKSVGVSKSVEGLKSWKKRLLKQHDDISQAVANTLIAECGESPDGALRLGLRFVTVNNTTPD